MLSRREFLGAGVAWTAGLAAAQTAFGTPNVTPPRFQRRFAPHFGQFRRHAGSDPFDQIKFFADEGFTALEDGGLRAKSPRFQVRIGEEVARRGMSMGAFVGVVDFGRPTFASGRADLRRDVLADLGQAIATARAVGGRYLSVVPGKRDANIPDSLQMRHAADMLRRCCDLCEPAGVLMLLDPIDHGVARSRLFVRSARQAASLCRSVGRPSCRVMLDVHQQASAGENLPRLVDEIAEVLGYVQLADYPGRKEPGSGEIAFGPLFAALDRCGYSGIFGMEHGCADAGLEGERAVLAAYDRLERAGRFDVAGTRRQSPRAGRRYRPNSWRSASFQLATSRSSSWKTSIE